MESGKFVCFLASQSQFYFFVTSKTGWREPLYFYLKFESTDHMVLEVMNDFMEALFVVMGALARPYLGPSHFGLGLDLSFMARVRPGSKIGSM